MRIGIIGYEQMHLRSYVKSLKKIDGVEVVSICEGDEKIGGEFASMYGLEYFSEQFQFLSSNFDAVVICSANVRHAEMTVAAAKTPKHILVEKPIVTTFEDVQKIIDECAANFVGVIGWNVRIEEVYEKIFLSAAIVSYTFKNLYNSLKYLFTQSFLILDYQQDGKNMVGRRAFTVNL